MYIYCCNYKKKKKNINIKPIIHLFVCMKITVDSNLLINSQENNCIILLILFIINTFYSADSRDVSDAGV